jgi:hypothetical protein
MYFVKRTIQEVYRICKRVFEQREQFCFAL